MSRSFLSYLVSIGQPFLIYLLLVRANLAHASSSKLSSVVVYLVLVDGGCLNALLTADSIPSNSYNLLWNRDLDSIGCLETCSHQWQVLSPSADLGKHECPLIDGLSQVFDLNTTIHTGFIALCTLIPIFIINGISCIC